MSEDTQQYVKVENHDKRIWFGITPNSLWKIVWLAGFIWIGGGRDFINGKKDNEYATKIDLQRIESELKTVDRKVSFLSGRAGMYQTEDGTK